MPPARLGSGGLFGDQQGFAGDPFLQCDMLRRVGDVDPAGDHPDGGAGVVAQRAFVRCSVDAAREAGDDGETRLGQCGAEIACQFDRGGAGISCADQRDARFGAERQIAPAGEDRRGAVEFGQQRGVIGLIVEQIARACLA